MSIILLSAWSGARIAVPMTPSSLYYSTYGAMTLIGIATGNPGVFPGYPYPYPSLPVPGPWGMGLAGTGHGFFSMCHISDTV